jgi:hypothetical protein
MYAYQPQYNALPSLGLSLNGSCGYEIQNGQVVITISEIANNRELENISGTLAIELWAVNSPYMGADFTGVALASTQIGELFGQHFLSDCRYDLNFQEPPEGTWILTLMLREWTEAGYETRDYVNFELPYIVAGKPSILRNETDNVISVSFSGNRTAAATKAPAAKAGKVKTVAQDQPTVSLNSASLKEIVAVKGVSKKLAENIEAARPFESLDEVLKVKGMGPKLWQKIRNFLSL